MSSNALKEAERIMVICNACRYCEGFCAVFPAMERRRTFTESDLKYLANLCHNCRGCYYACQYAPPHEFLLNVPKTLAQLQQETYGQFAWPAAMRRVFQNNGIIVSLVTALVTALTMLFFGFANSRAVFQAHSGAGSFYKVIPYWLMVVPFSFLGLFVLYCLWRGACNAWREIGSGAEDLKTPHLHLRAIRDVLFLKYLDGGGHGCNYPDDRFRMIRRYFHHAVFYGFFLCFASTTVAFLYDHLLGVVAPYPFLSWPVMLGTTGGLAIIAGTSGLMYLKFKMDTEPAFPEARGMDVVFAFNLWIVSLTGLLLLVLRSTSLMGTLLVIHVGLVAGLFVTLPYGKFVHAIYRYLSLLRNAGERSRES
jgi:citrate/tricarballylate utilization protein